MNNMLGDISYSTIAAVKPELFLVLATLFLLVQGVYVSARVTQGLVWTALVALGATGWLLIGAMPSESWTAFNGMVLVNHFTVAAKMLILTATGLVLLLASGWLCEGEGKPFESVILMLLATVGMMLMVSSADFLALYMALELSSLALYVLASFNRDHAKSAEAGLKYFVLGALASGMLLFGISLIYGFGGSTNFAVLADTLSDGNLSKGFVVGLVLVVIGFCFKLSAAPFHMWTPDVYEGAPTPVTAFFATAPKIAALALFMRIMLEPFMALIDQWQQIIIAVSVLSMLVGALAAIMQTNIKRLLAYSSIGHVGFMLMALAVANQPGVQAMLIYLALYIFMSAGAFGCVLLMQRDGKAVEEIKDLRGLAEYRPWLAGLIGVFMFSMAGIPPLSGFFGKFYVIIAVVNGGMVWLAVIGVVTSVISAYYYLKVVKVMYFDAPDKKIESAVPFAVQLGLVIATVVTLLFFLIPTPLIEQAAFAAEVLIP